MVKGKCGAVPRCTERTVCLVWRSVLVLSAVRRQTDEHHRDVSSSLSSHGLFLYNYRL